ncbi:MAG TPA: nucleotide sugar dehydrogenase [Gaiellales bacterium]
MKENIAVIGAGYVGLPLAVAFAEAGHAVLCVEPDAGRVDRINAGDSYIKDVTPATLGVLTTQGLLRATTDWSEVAGCDDVIVCVPTPLTENREPDLSYISSATDSIAPHLRTGHLIVLESTTYPGTTREHMGPMLERGSGLKAGVDFHLAMSPERIDPGRTDFTVKTMPKIVGGLTQACTDRAVALYSKAIDTMVPVSAPEAAELAKLLENIFRSVNIALMNEMAMLCDRMGVDVWEVADAAATKPFGFMRFTPGPGLGGHCIPLDPFYLSWRARQFDFHTEFIELAGKVNQNMPYYCREKVARALNSQAKPLRGSKTLVVGVAYKPDIDDTRESPALKVIELLREEGCEVSYHDPYVAHMPDLELDSVDLDAGIASSDCVVIVTNHSTIDYADLVDRAKLVVDFRNATGTAGRGNDKVVKL